MAMRGNTKMALCSIPPSSLRIFTPLQLWSLSLVPLPSSTDSKFWWGLGRLGQIATPQQMVQQCMGVGEGGRRLNNNGEEKKKAYDQLHQNITTCTDTPHPTFQCNLTCKILENKYKQNAKHKFCMVLCYFELLPQTKSRYTESP